MATQFDIDCALMAGGSYISNRPDINRFPVPTGWATVDGSHFSDTTSGFEAVTFTDGNQFVISFAGTNPQDLLGDGAADTALAAGIGSTQLFQAAEYYMQVKAANPNATITFTGHSLGGGLASLMSVFFNEKAVTFDQAPFRAAANTVLAAALRLDLAAMFPDNIYPQVSKWLDPLDNFILSLNPWGENGMFTREANVTTINVQGEFLSASSFLRIGTSANTTKLEHGTPTLTTLALTMDLHSQALLAAFLENDKFRQVTYKLTDLVGMIFNTDLYKYDTGLGTEESKENFIDRLVRHESGTAPNATDTDMLTRFTADLWKIAQEGGMTLTNKDVAQTLTAFAMQMYYEKDTPANKTLFDSTGITGAIHFNRSDVADTLNLAGGFNLYFKNYLDTLPGNENSAITAQLPNLLDWYIQAGYSAMEATAGDQRAFMLGGDKGDNLFGGLANDVLVGGKGIDVLMGGKGDDILIGGEGNDYYYYRIGDGNDRIIDNGRTDRLFLKESDGTAISSFGLFHANGSNKWTSADGRFNLTESSTWMLSMPDGGSIDLGNTFQNGDFGIRLVDQDTAPELTGITLNGDQKPTLFTDVDANGNSYDYYKYDDLGNIIASGSEPGRADTLFGSAQNDRISGGDGADTLYGDAGDDILDGGAGNDLISGETGNDQLIGGTGNDSIRGGGGDDALYADQEQEQANLYLAGETGDGTGARGDLLSGESGDDQLYGAAGNDVLLGGAGNDIIIAGAGDDTIEGDCAFSSPNTSWDVIRTVTQEGNTTFYKREYTGGVVDTAVEQGDDDIYTGAGNDWVFAQGGNDFVDAGTGNDVVFGDGGDDIILGQAGDDVLSGDSADTPASEMGNDYIDGGAGNDKIWGDGGDDDLIGGAGDDLLTGGTGDDYLEGGAGDDQLWGDNGDSTGDGSDYLSGGTGNDQLQGGGGDDELYGDEGNDILFGQDGNDTLTGGAGVDYLIGGLGDDTYIFEVGDSPVELTGNTIMMEGIDDREGVNNIILPDDFRMDTSHTPRQLPAWMSPA